MEVVQVFGKKLAPVIEEAKQAARGAGDMLILTLAVAAVTCVFAVIGVLLLLDARDNRGQ